jgi:hypothetical protein
MKIEKQLGQILQFLAERQGENGEFRSLESYPAEHPLGDRGWFYTDPSPFVHANILCALSGLSDPMAAHIIKQGCHFLLHQMEWKGLWRFWAHGGQTHNVPIDLDDTALCSFALASGGFPLDNKKYILQNVNPDGYFLTWLLPHFSMWRYPALYRFLKKDLRNIQLVLASPMLSLDDFEPAVAANVLLYLGDTPKTRPCILQILQQLEKPDSMPLQYYADPLVAFYHVSRAYFHGVKGLAPAADIFRRLLAQGVFPEPANLFNKAMMAATCLHFNLDILPDMDKWIAEIGEAAEKAQWESHIYFVSKDRNFRAGSPELTAAFCAEALFLYQTKKVTV